MKIKTFETPKKSHLNTWGRFLLATLILILVMSIIWILNPKAIDTRGNKSTDFQTVILHICSNGFTEMEVE